MAAKIVAIVFIQFALFNVLQAQCINRFQGLIPGFPGLPGMPSCGPNILPVAETILPNQVLLNSNYPSPIVEVPYGVETIVSNPVMPATTIIQDSTVANNLANALQLLVVSNLLSNTLPTAGEIIVPSYGPAVEYGMMSPVVSSCGYGPYNYVY